MLQKFPSEGTRVVLLRDSGAIRKGSVGVLVKSMAFPGRETPEDVFVLDHRGERLWMLRRDLDGADD